MPSDPNIEAKLREWLQLEEERGPNKVRILNVAPLQWLVEVNVDKKEGGE